MASADPLYLSTISGGVSTSDEWTEARCWLLPYALDTNGTMHKRFASGLSSYCGIDLDDDLPEEAIAALRQIRVPILVAAALCAVAACLQAYCMVEGWMALFCLDSVSRGCTPLWYWTLAFCTAVSSTPICVVPAEIAVVSCISLAQVARGFSHDCGSELCNFTETVLQFGLPSLAIVAVAAGLGRCCLPKLSHVHACWCTEGPAPPEVVSLVADGAVETMPKDAECAVCISEASDLSRCWVSLKCGHGFHEDCLCEWLLRSSRCPLCRLDLRTAYSSA
jgi:hypothetical protein